MLNKECAALEVLLSFWSFQIISGVGILANHFLIQRISLKCHRSDHQPFLGLPSIKQFCQFAFVKLRDQLFLDFQIGDADRAFNLEDRR